MIQRSLLFMAKIAVIPSFFLVVCLSAKDFMLTPSYKGETISFTSVRYVFQSKKLNEFEILRLNTIDKLDNELKLMFGEGNSGRLYIPSDSLKRIEKVKLSRRSFFSSFVPEKPGVKDGDKVPDIIIFVKRFRAREKTRVESVQTGIGYGTKEQEYMKFSFTYFFWDNKNGKIIGFAELSSELGYGRDGISESDLERIANMFCMSIVSSLKSIR